MAVKNSILTIPMISIASSSLNTMTYTALNPAGIPKACFQIKIFNNSDEDVFVSFDGSTDADYIIAGANVFIPTIFSAQPNTYVANFSLGTIVYLKGTAGTGDIYLAGYYQAQGV